MDINEIARQFGVSVSGSAYYSACIAKWRDIYENRPVWKTAKKGGLFSRGDRQLLRLNMAKVLCDSFSALTFAEQCEVTLDNADYQRYIDGALNANGFWKQLPELLCSAYALGGCVLKCYLEDGKPKIDYIIADRFVPVRWDGRGISEGIFISTTSCGKDFFHLLEYNGGRSPAGGGKSEFKLFKSADENTLGNEVELSELYPELTPTVEYPDQTPMFAYFKPFVSNNEEYDTPLGMSVYANCLDTLKSLDTVFDSLMREFVLGKKRIIVPSSCIRTIVDPETGAAIRYFDSDDEAFVALKSEGEKDVKITDNTAELRVEQHVSAINAYLNILCMQTGLSAGTFSFDVQQGMKTATEIISQESKTARTVKNNKNLLAETIEGVVRALVVLGQMSQAIPKQEYTVTIGWHDNIVIDENTLIDNMIKLYSAGLISRERAIMNIYKCDPQTAKEETERIKQEASVGGGNMDFFGSDDE